MTYITLPQMRAYIGLHWQDVAGHWTASGGSPWCPVVEHCSGEIVDVVPSGLSTSPWYTPVDVDYSGDEPGFTECLSDCPDCLVRAPQ
jgi:hypothetical protein